MLPIVLEKQYYFPKKKADQLNGCVGDEGPRDDLPVVQPDESILQTRRVGESHRDEDEDEQYS